MDEHVHNVQQLLPIFNLECPAGVYEAIRHCVFTPIMHLL